MKTILFPTDFSKNAAHASEYAGMLAKIYDANIVILNTYFIPMVPENPMAYEAQSAIESNKQEAIEDLEKFAETFISKAHLHPTRVSQRVEYGFPADKIVEIANEIKADMIVMGTKGASDILDKWLGTNAQKVMKEALCPVWIIPSHTHIKQPQKIMYAADFKEDEVTATQHFLDIVKPLETLNKVIHINDFFEQNTESVVQEKVGDLREEFKQENILIRNIKREDVIEGLETYIETFKPSILALAVHEKSFLEKIFDVSVTKHFVQEAKLPILTFRK
ncbi:universal stress protein [Arcicella sp. LKC2W]|uniref:universal stress protein n=1 Tax=Arcicella sp. LKC2W TaxID=2984198 RepID=UPI002B1F456D|nr:universal stress protein [Arcicella sp. LKC2W]MEA5459017.1 universal stress protein [Arcicella sp. LKC2W]